MGRGQAPDGVVVACAVAPPPRRKARTSLRGQSRQSSKSEIVEKVKQIEKDYMKESTQRMQTMQVILYDLCFSNHNRIA
jgi:hypothetical protein